MAQCRVNYGMPADYEQLEALGVSVKGAIVFSEFDIFQAA
jgi:hypothetical protein